MPTLAGWRSDLPCFTKRYSMVCIVTVTDRTREASVSEQSANPI